MKTINYFLLLSIFWFLTACEKEAKNVDLPVVQPKLVVAAFLNPQEKQSNLFLSWSNPIYHNSDNTIQKEKDAKVFIEYLGNLYQMLYNTQNERYEISKSQLPIKAGDTYKMIIKSDKVSQTLEAETIVPEKPDFEAKYIGMDSLLEEDYNYSYYEYRFFVDLKIKNSESPGYYRILAQGVDNNGTLINFLISRNENRKIYGDMTERIYLSPDYFSENLKLKKIFFTVQKCDETYYRYNHALEVYSDFDIFAEPTQVYSNVDNALGVFCSYNSITDTLIVK
jgi:hypothetical protein